MAEIQLVPVDRVDITTLIDNSTDLLLADHGEIRRWGLAGSAGTPTSTTSALTVDGSTLDPLRAEHGFSALIELEHDGRRRRILYDAGVSTDGLVGNLDRLCIAPDTFEAIVLSHGHWDHVMGLHGLIRRLGRANLPVVLHPDFWTRRRIARPDQVVELPTPSRRAIEDAGFTIFENRQPSFLFDGRLLVTGEVARTTAFETGMPPGHQAWRNGAWAHDPHVHEDQAAVLHVRDRGLVILTGCGHAGIVNIVRHAKRLTGVSEVYAVLGGLHLRDGPVMTASVHALAAERPALVAPAHCTSWLAHRALADALPDAYQPNAVGSRFQLTSVA